MAIAYWFRNGSNFDDVCAPVVGGGVASGVPSAYRVTNAGALMSDRYMNAAYGETAFSVFGNSGFFANDKTTDISQLISAINRHIIPAAIPDVTATSTAPSPATAGIRFNSDRNIDRQINGSYLTVDQWALPLATVSLFEVRFVAVSGDTGSLVGADSVWSVLSSNREVSLTASAGAGSNLSATVRAEWRKTGETLYFSDTFNLTASQS